MHRSTGSFYNASHRAGERLRGPLTTLEIQRQKTFWEKRVQRRVEGINTFEEDRQRLNLQSNADGVLECKGRIQGHYPLYLPDKSIYAKKIVEEAHLATLHGGVSLTIASLRTERKRYDAAWRSCCACVFPRLLAS